MNDEPERHLRFYLFRNAAERFDIDRDNVITRLIADDPSILNVRNGIGETALHFLVVENDLDAVRFLVEAGADVNTRNNFGDTPLMDAASLGYGNLYRYLLGRGADPFQRAGWGDNVVSAAAFQSREHGDTSRLEMLQLVLESIGDRDVNDFIDAYAARKIVSGTHKRVAPEVAALLIERGLTTGCARPDDEGDEQPL